MRPFHFTRPKSSIDFVARRRVVKEESLRSVRPRENMETFRRTRNVTRAEVISGEVITGYSVVIKRGKARERFEESRGRVNILRKQLPSRKVSCFLTLASVRSTRRLECDRKKYIYRARKQLYRGHFARGQTT